MTDEIVTTLLKLQTLSTRHQVELNTKQIFEFVNSMEEYNRIDRNKVVDMLVRIDQYLYEAKINYSFLVGNEGSLVIYLRVPASNNIELREELIELCSKASVFGQCDEASPSSKPGDFSFAFRFWWD